MIATVNRADALAERLTAATRGALEPYSACFGAELCLHRTLAGHGSLTAAELAEQGSAAVAREGRQSTEPEEVPCNATSQPGCRACRGSQDR
jgi:hypothetical protein